MTIRVIILATWLLGMSILGAFTLHEQERAYRDVIGGFVH